MPWGPRPDRDTTHPTTLTSQLHRSLAPRAPTPIPGGDPYRMEAPLIPLACCSRAPRGVGVRGGRIGLGLRGRDCSDRSIRTYQPKSFGAEISPWSRA